MPNQNSLEGSPKVLPELGVTEQYERYNEKAERAENKEVATDVVVNSWSEISSALSSAALHLAALGDLFGMVGLLAPYFSIKDEANKALSFAALPSEIQQHMIASTYVLRAFYISVLVPMLILGGLYLDEIVQNSASVLASATSTLAIAVGSVSLVVIVGAALIAGYRAGILYRQIQLLEKELTQMDASPTRVLSEEQIERREKVMNYLSICRVELKEQVAKFGYTGTLAVLACLALLVSNPVGHVIIMASTAACVVAYAAYRIKERSNKSNQAPEASLDKLLKSSEKNGLEKYTHANSLKQESRQVSSIEMKKISEKKLSIDAQDELSSNRPSERSSLTLKPDPMH